MLRLIKRLLLKIVAPVVVSTVATTTVVVSPPTSAPKFVTQNYEKSITTEAFCNLSAEASESLIGDLFYSYMDIENNKVDGWTHVYEKTTINGFSYALWVNQNDSSVYTLVFAGTDSLKDTLTYLPMMVKDSGSLQMNQAVEATKNIPNIISENPETCGKINQLYITGHSLGGYLAMYIASELVDSSINSEHTYSISIEDLGLTSIDQMKCITFGAPGMYYYPMQYSILSIPITPFPQGEWQKRKVQNNENKLYDKYIIQFINSQDIVGNLLKTQTQITNLLGGVKLHHIGTFKSLSVSPMSAAQKSDFEKKAKSLIGNILGTMIIKSLDTIDVTNGIYSHCPWTYISALKEHNFNSKNFEETYNKLLGK